MDMNLEADSDSFQKLITKGLNLFEKITRKKQSSYSWLLTSKYMAKNTFGLNVALNLDDPLYTEAEIKNIIAQFQF